MSDEATSLDELHGSGDGPTEPARKRGRPPGSKTRKRKRPAPRAEREPKPSDDEQPAAGELDDDGGAPVLTSAEELADWLRKASLTAWAGTVGTKFELAGAALGWHDPTDTSKPSGRALLGARMLWPWLEESGVLDVARLTPEAKAAIGLLVLVGPAIPALIACVRDVIAARRAVLAGVGATTLPAAQPAAQPAASEVKP